MKLKSGQSIIEVVIATTLISIGIIAALSLTNQSQKSSNYAKMLDTANSYNNQLADYLRNQKNIIGWGNLIEKLTSDSSGGYAYYCYNTLSENEDFLEKTIGPCDGSSTLSGTVFSREVEFDARSLDSGILPVKITTSWEEKTTRSATLNLELSQWK